jgi:hypothetical protein
MKQDYFSGLGLAALMLLGSSLAYSQQTKLHVDDDGKMIASHEKHHTKAGRKVTWVRHSSAKKPWFIHFTGESPCKEGQEFGSDRAKTCTINVACKAAGDSGCKSYPYQSATGPKDPLHDPEIIVDP